MLTPGSAIPTFSLTDQNGAIISNKDLKGKKVALFFYPKDNTPGCTAQACNLRDNIALLKKKGITVIGVSADKEKTHKRFGEKFGLPFPLLSDPERVLIEAFGVWGEKTLWGRTYMGIHRVTFLINKKGLVEHVIDTVNTKDHAAQILEIWK